jgi:hypothetical protein
MGSLTCPCCGFLTLAERGTGEVCRVCFWDDNGQDDHDADDVKGGPNHSLSLTQARHNYAAYGASRPGDLPFVRAPYPHERPG